MRTFEPSRGMLEPMDQAERSTVAAEDVLVQKARRGDREAFDQLMERHLPKVWGMVWRILRHREDSEDVVQEVFLAAYQALPEFRGEASLSTWLCRIAVTRALNHVDRAAEKVRRASQSLQDFSVRPRIPGAARPGLQIADRGPSPLQELEARELARRLSECLSRLPAAWRTVIALRDVDALAYEEISRVLGIALGTVRSRLARARLALRQCVQGETT
jgi:RNA polymerase sigma-70 factor (ECF subfamily)